MGQARPEPGLQFGLGPSFRSFKAQALESQAQALKAGPSQARTSLDMMVEVKKGEGKIGASDLDMHGTIGGQGGKVRKGEGKGLAPIYHNMWAMIGHNIRRWGNKKGPIRIGYGMVIRDTIGVSIRTSRGRVGSRRFLDENDISKIRLKHGKESQVTFSHVKGENL